ncbi:MAG: RNA methyltransferase [Bacteroidota bacterium]
MRKLQTHELSRLSPEAFQVSKKKPLVLVLDNVRSMHNVGAAFRIADAFLLEKIYLCGITGTPPHREIHKTALGAEAHVAWEHAEDTLSVIDRLKATGYQVVAVEQAAGSEGLDVFTPAAGQPYALVFGHEVFGVQDDVLAACDACVEIPQQGVKHSLNVSVSMGIVVWHFMS